MKKRRRALICGTHYGYRYLTAVARDPERYELAGILARGSLRSILLAAQYGVPLYRDVAEVPDAIDVAYAAMGPDGDGAVLELLRRGVDVLCEHPVSEAFVRKALAATWKSGAAFDVNAHFALLDAPRAFIRRCARQRQREGLAFIDAMLTPRLLYALLDILRHAAGPLRPRRNSIGGAPAHLRFERLIPDGSPDSIVDCRIAAGFPSGILTLLSMAGPVIWTGNYRRNPRAISQTVFGHEGLTAAEFAKQRQAAIARAMASLGKGKPSAEHLLDVSRAVERLVRRRL